MKTTTSPLPISATAAAHQSELWLPVIGYEGLYEISNYGRVRNQTGRLRILHKSRWGGYLALMLNSHTVKKTMRVHRMVAMAFIPNSENKAFVNHKDGVRTNNHVSNLEWVTKGENQLHAYQFLGRKAFTKGCISVCKSIDQLTLTGEYIRTFSSMAEAAKLINVTRQAIYANVKGKNKSSGGFHWRLSQPSSLKAHNPENAA